DVRNFDHVFLGKQMLTPWYFSPYQTPEDQNVVYVCPWCFKYTSDPRNHCDHLDTCQFLVPGQCLYSGKDSNTGRTVAVYEIDGRIEKVFCQGLCLLTKLFLDHKVQPEIVRLMLGSKGMSIELLVDCVSALGVEGTPDIIEAILFECLGLIVRVCFRREYSAALAGQRALVLTKLCSLVGLDRLEKVHTAPISRPSMRAARLLLSVLSHPHLSISGPFTASLRTAVSIRCGRVYTQYIVHSSL
ncbi:hypothetical protein KIPB_014080, partial [Kipferlia bialata]